jgi:hypothetical protein
VNYLTRARERAGLSLYEVPALVPVSVVRLAYYESGLLPAPVELLAALMDHPRFAASAGVLAMHALLASGMLPSAVARFAGVDQSDVTKWRTGDRMVPENRGRVLISHARALFSAPRRVSPPAPAIIDAASIGW